MDIMYFKDVLSEEEALTTGPDALEEGIVPEVCFKTVRETMEELAYRTAVTYNDNKEPSLYYWTTLKGISCSEVGKRNNRVESIPLSCQES